MRRLVRFAGQIAEGRRTIDVMEDAGGSLAAQLLTALRANDACPGIPALGADAPALHLLDAVS